MLAAFVGFVLLALIVIYVRVWWLQRKLDDADRDGARPSGGGETVDAEYRVIDISDPDAPRRD